MFFRNEQVNGSSPLGGSKIKALAATSCEGFLVGRGRGDRRDCPLSVRERSGQLDGSAFLFWLYDIWCG